MGHTVHFSYFTMSIIDLTAIPGPNEKAQSNEHWFKPILHIIKGQTYFLPEQCVGVGVKLWDTTV